MTIEEAIKLTITKEIKLYSGDGGFYNVDVVSPEKLAKFLSKTIKATPEEILEAM